MDPRQQTLGDDTVGNKTILLKILNSFLDCSVSLCPVYNTEPKAGTILDRSLQRLFWGRWLTIFFNVLSLSGVIPESLLSGIQSLKLILTLQAKSKAEWIGTN